MNYYVIQIGGGFAGAYFEAQAGPFKSREEADLHISDLKQVAADCVLVLEIEGTLISCEEE